MTTAFLLCLISINGLVFSLKRTGVFQKVITIWLSAAVFMTWLQDNNVLMVSYLMVLAFAILSVVYGLAVKELKTDLRVSVAGIGLITALSFVFAAMNYPGLGIIQLAQIIPLILFVRIIILRWKQLPKELGFMLILSALAAQQLLAYFFK